MIKLRKEDKQGQKTGIYSEGLTFSLPRAHREAPARRNARNEQASTITETANKITRRISKKAEVCD